ncbi:MAG: hypothetical protein JSU92_10455 [Deltaproteobacteria bacterium]|nr:MAG: hypothetical protein JSU92_10455 [Deltaproteobacteria bacterium]
MFRVIARIGLFSLILILLTGPARAEEEEKTAVNPKVPGKKTLTRTEDFVIIHGEKLTKNLYNNISNMSLFAFTDGEIKPVPFQIDEINSEGEWVLPTIPHHLKDKDIKPDVDDDSGNLDRNDELVFMVRDSGDRIAKERYPEGAVAVDEITLTDPIDGGKSWVYLCSFAEKPPLSDKDYVKYVFPEDQIISDSYTMGFTTELPNSPSFISIGGGENILDRMKIRFRMKAFGLPFSLDETNFLSELSLYKDGPIRIVRRIRTAIGFSKRFRTPSAAIENIYYSNSSAIPIRIQMPMSMKPFKRFIKINVRGGADFQNMDGWLLGTNVTPGWFNIDGKMDEAEKDIKNEGRGFDWFLASGPKDAFMIRIVLDRRPDGSLQKTPITTRLHYVDDKTVDDPPESVPGQTPHVGYWMDGIEELPKGTFYFYTIMHFVKDYKEGVEKDYLRILDKPIEVSVN